MLGKSTHGTYESLIFYFVIGAVSAEGRIFIVFKLHMYAFHKLYIGLLHFTVKKNHK